MLTKLEVIILKHLHTLQTYQAVEKGLKQKAEINNLAWNKFFAQKPSITKKNLSMLNIIII